MVENLAGNLPTVSSDHAYERWPGPNPYEENKSCILGRKKPFRHFSNIIYLNLQCVCAYVFLLYVYMYIGQTGVNVHTFAVYSTKS